MEKSVQAAELNLFHIESQFVYFVTDTDSLQFDMGPFIQLAGDGYNLAFVFNTRQQRHQCSVQCPCKR